MVHKMYTSLLLTTMLMPVLSSFGMSTNNLTNQLNHVQKEIKAVTLSWQRAEATLHNIRKIIPPTLYQQAETIAQSILSLPEVIAKMKKLVNQQLTAIALYNKPYEAVNFLDDYFPETIETLNQSMRIICMAIANKAFRLLLGQKLTIKEKELLVAIEQA